MSDDTSAAMNAGRAPSGATRRDFLRYSSILGLGAAGLLTAACGGQQRQASEPPAGSPATGGSTELYPEAEAKAMLESLDWPETMIAEPGEPVKLTVAGTWSPTLLERQRQFDEFFMSRHPNIEVVIEVTPFADYLQKYLTQMAGGTAPDIMVVQYAWVQQFVRAGWFRPLDDYIAQQTDFDRDDFTKPATAFYEQDDQLFAIPYDCGPLMLFYNRDLFAKFGIDEPDENWTLDDLKQAALTMSTGSGVDKTFGLAGVPYPDGFFSANYLAPFGGRYLDDDETSCLLGEQASIDAANFWLDPFLNNAMMPGDADNKAMGADAFTLGRAGMAIQGTWAAAGLLDQADFDWAIAPYPKGPKRHTTAAAGSGFAITEEAKNPDAAWIYLNEYLSSAGQTFMWASTGLGSPSRSSAWPAYLESQYAPDGAEYALEALNSYATTEGVNFGPATPQVDATAFPIWDRVVNGSLSVADGCQEITESVTPLLEQNR
ncbi:ABC transporter substrate-binding protein [Jiangella muralis]|uniref:ABC transporter substrate-binding protein n=1 Tax=Jiangella muralis TaxID=702383 RepID=UPI00069E0F0E|nr:sugar ABC transporter substrate-binding protein [Jiangella muralis]